MAHFEQQDFCARVRAMWPAYFVNKRVLDCGSLDINGSNRPFFSGGEYIGIDLGPGRGVDVVCPIHLYDAPKESFDVVISTECLEHDRHWKESLLHMVWLLKPGGLMVVSCATTGRAEHGTRRTSPLDSPLTSALDGWADYYKNLTEEDVMHAITVQNLFDCYAFEVNQAHADLYFWGIRG
jgi:SAM-dependent methyltransferase